MENPPAYTSRVRIERIRGPIREAFLPETPDPVVFGVHSEIAAHYGVPADAFPAHATTLDYVVAAAGGWLTGTFAGALEARGPRLEKGDLTAEVVGSVEKDGKVLVIRRIEVTYSLTLDAEHHEVAERVHEFHADHCPVARSIGGSIEIATRLEFR